MTKKEGVQIYNCNDVNEFLEKIQPPVALFEGGVSSTVIFRGVGSSDYELVPSLLREDQNMFREQIKAVYPNEKHIPDLPILRLFYQECNRNGLALPGVSFDTHQVLASGAVSPGVAGEMFHSLLPVFGLAQHYGLPTRLLDWSFDPFVAAFFAAYSGLKHLVNDQDVGTEGNGIDSSIAVWMVQSKYLNPDVDVVHVPYAGNANLAAQKGVFTFVYHIHDNTPLNEVCASEVGRKDFYQFTLPKVRAPELCVRLRSMGYDSGRLFPGYGGAARAVRELGVLSHSPYVRKTVFEG